MSGQQKLALLQNVMTKKEYARRREEHLCVRCGIALDNSKSMCPECAEKERLRVAENRKALKGMGYCPRCGKNKLYGDEKECIECAAKMYEYNQSHKSEKSKDYIKIRKYKGVCIKCGSRKPEDGKTRCVICNISERNRARDYRGIGLSRSERANYGMCYICGESIESGRLCDKCKKRAVSHLQGSAGNPYCNE